MYLQCVLNSDNSSNRNDLVVAHTFVQLNGSARRAIEASDAIDTKSINNSIGRSQWEFEFATHNGLLPLSVWNWIFRARTCPYPSDPLSKQTEIIKSIDCAHFTCTWIREQIYLLHWIGRRNRLHATNGSLNQSCCWSIKISAERQTIAVIFQFVWWCDGLSAVDAGGRSNWIRSICCLRP